MFCGSASVGTVNLLIHVQRAATKANFPWCIGEGLRNGVRTRQSLLILLLLPASLCTPAQASNTLSQGVFLIPF